MSSLKICDICLSSETDELNLGEWKELNSLTFHHYCLLLSTYRSRNGANEEDISGYSEENIRAIIDIGTTETCYICEGPNATIYCKGGCHSRAFHLRCGIQNRCLLQFVGEFNSFCPDHISVEMMCKTVEVCIISEKYIVERHRLMRVPSCCGKYWFHRDCFQRYAINAGDYLKCIACNENTEEYREMLRMQGIFIPNRKATWEEEGAYDKKKKS